MIYIKILLFKIARIVAILIGNVIRLFRGNKKINLRDIKKIIINRKDRIGDAIISKPFIILLSKYIREELGLNIEIIVECSEYNEFIFKDGNNKEYYNIKSVNTEITDYGVSFFSLLKQQFHKKSFGIKKNKNINCIFIDLVGNPIHVGLKKDGSCYTIGPNLLLNNYLLDYSLKNNYVSGVTINLIQSYINLVTGCFNISKFPDYVNKNIKQFYLDYNDSIEKKGILLYVGNKEYRNLNLSTWIKIINELSTIYTDKTITVIDDNTNTLYKKLTDKKFNSNVEIIENTYSLNNFKSFSKNFELLIGIDGGGFNIIRNQSNSITIYTIGNYNVWSPFIGDKKYTKASLGNNWIKAEYNMNGKRIAFIYKKSFLLPSFDQKISTKYFEDIILSK